MFLHYKKRPVPHGGERAENAKRASSRAAVGRDDARLDLVIISPIGGKVSTGSDQRSACREQAGPLETCGGGAVF